MSIFKKQHTAFKALIASGFLSAGLALPPITPVLGDNLNPHQQGALDLLSELISIRTVEGQDHSTSKASLLMAHYLKSVGFPANDIKILHQDKTHGLLVVRYHGDGSSGEKPILTMAHMDVVDALRSDWNMDPFQLNEKDGYLYGRGIEDNKTGAVMLVTTFAKLKSQGFVPNRDIIILLTADEETTGTSSTWMLKNHRDLIDAEFALNTDAGGGILSKGKPKFFSLQAAEKMYQSFTLTAKNPGGHSSVPRVDNAIYQLAAALKNLESFKFPVRTSEITRGYFKFLADQAPTSDTLKDDYAIIAGGKAPASVVARIAEAPYLNATLRTTCVATMLKGGHAENALPQTAVATVNCRIFPGVPAKEVQKLITKAIKDTNIKIAPVDMAIPSPPSPLRDDIIMALQAALEKHYSGVPIVPMMTTGATDGLFTRNAGIPTYGVSGIFAEEGNGRAHGQDERILKSSFLKAIDHWETLLKVLTK
jgi:acetylornithine deacetylase/succinyl-diaminopimelate desuccinylase-like protein